MKTILALLVMLAFSSPLLAEVTEFKDGGTHYINSATASYVLVDYQAPGGIQTTVNLIDGGSVMGLESYGTSRINVSGGVISDNLRAGESSQITMSGGILGGYLDATQNGQITIVGSSFMVDGELVDFGRLIYPSTAEGDEIARKLTGVLANGDLINNRFFIEGNSSSITLAPASVPEPSSLLVLVAGLLGIIRIKKSLRK